MADGLIYAAAVALIVASPLSAAPIPDDEFLLLDVQAPLAEGSPCKPGGIACQHGLECSCLVLSRGLHTCQSPGARASAAYEASRERKGLMCEMRVPHGVATMKLKPPRLATGKKLIDISTSAEATSELKDWSTSSDGGKGFYKYYMNLYVGDTAPANGFVLLAGPNLDPKYMHQLHEKLSGFISSFRHPESVLAALSSHGGPYKYLLQGTEAWRDHPEINKHYDTGPGGAAPVFPSVGCRATDGHADWVEEFWHTVQYTLMTPREVCMYHRGYEKATKAGIYHPDFLEYHGEPVPTTQADEYMAAAMRAWFGWAGAEEYSVTPHTDESDVAQARQRLLSSDPSGYCLLSMFFDENNLWPQTTSASTAHAQSPCHDILLSLAASCPDASLTWNPPK